MRIKTWQQRCEEHPDHDGIVSDGMIQARMQEEIDELRAAIEQAQPNARTHHKMMLAMIKENWRSIDQQWKDDQELCHALGYEAGYNDAVALRVEPRLGGSGAGFESLPASPQWQGLTDDEIKAPIQRAMQYFGFDSTQYSLGGAATVGFLGLVKEIEAKLKEKNT